jgi:hypothetical protein
MSTEDPSFTSIESVEEALAEIRRLRARIRVLEDELDGVRPAETPTPLAAPDPKAQVGAREPFPARPPGATRRPSADDIALRQLADLRAAIVRLRTERAQASAELFQLARHGVSRPAATPAEAPRTAAPITTAAATSVMPPPAARTQDAGASSRVGHGAPSGVDAPVQGRAAEPPPVEIPQGLYTRPAGERPKDSEIAGPASRTDAHIGDADVHLTTAFPAEALATDSSPALTPTMPPEVPGETPAGAPALPSPEEVGRAPDESGRPWFRPIAAVLVVALVVAGGIWLWRSSRGGLPPPAAAPPPVAATPSAPAMEPAPGAVAPSRPDPSAVGTGGEQTGVKTPALELRTVREVWLRIVVDGDRKVSGLVAPDERFVFDPGSTVTIRAGDAGAVEVVANGEGQGALGADGAVVTRTFDLSQDPASP